MENIVRSVLLSPIRKIMMKWVWEPKYWKKRIADVVECPDIKFIPTVTDAGQVKDGLLIMYNGLKIEPLSYYGAPMLKLFKKSKGIHEPQEERIFVEVLKKMPAQALMLELGSYWAFYSMCFNKAVNEAKNFMIEPTDFGINFGKKNFSLNGMSGNFTQSYIGKESGIAEDGTPITDVDDFVKEKDISFVDILHADIQGFEVEMLEGAKWMLLNKKVGYIFISTHSNDLHDKCVDMLKTYKYEILQSVNLDDTYSLDGLIVAVSPGYPHISHISLSRKDRKS